MFFVTYVRFIWTHLPVFLIMLIGISVLNTSLHQIDPPRMDSALLSAVPFITALILLWFAVRKSPVKINFPLWVLMVTLLYCLPLLPQSRPPLDLELQQHIYEVSTLAQFVIVFIHASRWLDRRGLFWIFGLTFFFGCILENGGIIMGFFQEGDFLVYVPGIPAPLATMVGWTNVFYISFYALDNILPRMNPLARGFMCALIGLSLDVAFDPVATKMGWWVWAESLDRRLFGVPLLNFVAWFWAIFPYAAVYYWVRGKETIGEGKKLRWFAGMIPVILMVELAGVLVSLVIVSDCESLEIFKNVFFGE
ncbi:MAG: carotenoid biosynthesis protein [Deltaproteobacteria bacterium]|nr:carotenoid biosynthesis protein [Deltaproteobacteria bacterium]